MPRFLFVLLCFLFFSMLANAQSYLGRTNKIANLRSEPKTGSTIIASLPAGKQIFIVSLNTENDYYNVIDIATDKEGYVHKSLIKVEDEVMPNEPGMFTPEGKSSSYNPEISIYNNTSLRLTLKLDEKLYSFEARERKKISLEPGVYNYRASAPGVIPNIGVEQMENNMEYSWEFYIVTQRN